MIEPKNIEPCFNCGIIDRYCQKKITEELEKIKAEVDKKYDELYVIDEFTNGKADSYVELFEIIDKHISEMKGENRP